MSPDRAAVRTRRVIRAGAVPSVPATTFPTIVEVPRPVPVTAADESGAHDVCDVAPADRGPAIDPEVLETARLEAAASGYEDGFAAGRDEAIAAVRREAQDLLARLDAAVTAFEARRQHNFDALTDGVAHFALSTVEAILDREIELAANPVRESIERALRLAPDRIDAMVVVHPDDAALIGDVEPLAGTRAIEVVQDATVERGACVVRAGDCEVDAQLSGALDRLRGVLGVRPEAQA